MSADLEDRLCAEIDWVEACRTQAYFDGGAFRLSYIGPVSATDASRIHVCGPYVFVCTSQSFVRYGPLFDSSSGSETISGDRSGPAESPPAEPVTVLNVSPAWWEVLPLANGELVLASTQGDSDGGGGGGGLLLASVPAGASSSTVRRNAVTGFVPRSVNAPHFMLAADRALGDRVLYLMSTANKPQVLCVEPPIAAWLDAAVDPVEPLKQLQAPLNLPGDLGTALVYSQSDTKLCALYSGSGPALNVVVMGKSPLNLLHIIRLPGCRYYNMDSTDELVVIGSRAQILTGFDLVSGAGRFSVSSAQFSHNGLHLSPAAFTVTDSGSKGVLRDPHTGDVRTAFVGHRSWVQLIRHDPSGTVVFTGSNDGTVRVWDAATGRCKHIIAVCGELKALVQRGPQLVFMTGSALFVATHTPTLDADTARQMEQEAVERSGLVYERESSDTVPGDL